MLKPRTKVPNIEIDLVNDTHWSLEEQRPDFLTMVLFYRGKHCPVCKKQLQTLQGKLDEFTKRGVNVIAISSDTESKAKETYDQWDIGDIPIGFEYPIEEARKWGLFISSGIKDEPDHFIEPGIFLIRPDGELYAGFIQSTPFARPGFDDLLNGIDYIKKNDYPARGEA